LYLYVGDAFLCCLFYIQLFYTRLPYLPLAVNVAQLFGWWHGLSALLNSLSARHTCL